MYSTEVEGKIQSQTLSTIRQTAFIWIFCNYTFTLIQFDSTGVSEG